MGLKHSHTATGTNDAAKQVSVDRWNENHVVDGQVDFPLDTTPATPAADNVGIFGRKIAERMMPAFIGPSGLDTAIQPLIARNKVGWFNPPGNATTIHQHGLVLTATGVATAANVAATNIHTAMRRLEYAVTVAAVTAVAGYRSAVAQYFMGALGGFHHVARFGRSRGVAANATLRGFFGLSSLTGAPTDVNPSTTETNAIGVGCDAADTNYQMIHRLTTGVATKVDTGIAKAVSDTTEMYELAMFSPPGGTTVGYLFTRLSDGVNFGGTMSTTLPAAGTLLALRGWHSVGGTSSVIGVSLANLYIETDN